ncbi:MAG: DUF6286 domain-containing protein [Acidimicrobiales bacterium]
MRLFSRLLAAAAALALLAGGLLVTVEIGLGLAQRDSLVIPWESWRREWAEAAWSSDSARWAAGILAAAGALLLLVAAAGRRPHTLQVKASTRTDRSDVDASAVRDAVRRDAEALDGVSRARVKLGRKALVVQADSSRAFARDLPADLRARAETRLAQLGLARPLPVRTRVSTRSKQESR